jgi:dTDP-glucose pyrophosphorylase
MYKSILVYESTELKVVLKKMNKSTMQIVLVIDSNNKLIGTITDGDVRRGLLNGLRLEDSIESITYKTPAIARVGDSKTDILHLARLENLHQIPIVDDKGCIVDLFISSDFNACNKKSNKVILMVGGLGTRLRPLTEKTPKSLLKVGDKPILQTIVERFVEYGFTDIIMCVNYKAEIIKSYFKDGSDFGASIEYILETKRMGTAGALSLLTENPDKPFFVMNGDVLTNVNFESILRYHLEKKADLTMCVREYDFEVPYGVVSVKNSCIESIIEKPIHSFFVNAGIYILNPNALDFIPKNDYYDMPTLFQKMIDKNNNVVSFPIHEYWLDIGNYTDFSKAQEYTKLWL